jgi:hypothetical protein
MRSHLPAARRNSSRSVEVTRTDQEAPVGRDARRLIRIDAADRQIKAALRQARSLMFRSPNWATEFEGMDAP